jgi:hypothetical protein
VTLDATTRADVGAFLKAIDADDDVQNICGTDGLVEFCCLGAGLQKINLFRMIVLSPKGGSADAR